MTNYESIYPGATYLLDPNYGGFTGYKVPAGQLGGTTSIQTANQLKEVTNLLNQGMKTTEISLINPEVFEMVPKTHFKEIERLNKLTGAESTLHAPTIDPSGFTQQGWSEENREAVERQFTEFVKRSHDLDPKGNIPVTIHASSIPGTEMMPEKISKFVKEEEKGKGPVVSRMIAVDQSTGQFIPMEREKRFYPRDIQEHPEGKIYTPEEELEIANTSYWDQKLSQLVFYKDGGDKLLREFYPLVAGIDLRSKEDVERLTPEQQAAFNQIKNAKVYLDNTYLSLNSLYNQAYKYSDADGRKELRKASENLKMDFEKARESDIGQFSHAIQNLINKMQEITVKTPPKIYKPVEDFAKEKASETLSNVAVNNYKKFGDTSPIVSIENPPYGTAISTGEDLKKLIDETRKKFVKKLVSEGKSTSEAKKAAEKVIGATWDTSHISMMRKQGFDKKQIVKETKKIAPYVKHVHYNDNFGSTHTDLPPGMGDLPIGDITQELEKAKFKGKKIFEGGNFFQHFQTTPMPYVFEGAGSPVYEGGPGWNQLGGQGNYYFGHGAVNPQIHHSLYGAGFTTLPVELGGEMAGNQNRFSGTPNQ